jgi:hypothetical protein
MRNQIKTFRIGSIAIAMLPIFLPFASAADISLHALEGNMVTVSLAEGIVRSDLAGIAKEIQLANDSGKTVVALELNSWGGSGDGGLMIADFVHRTRTKVFITGKCWSACSFAALVALGQGDLLVGPYADVGVHQVYNDDDHLPNRPWTLTAARILRKYGAPQAPLDAMIDTVPSSLTHYGVIALEGMGAQTVKEGLSWALLFGQ